jgi:hypothetical protein
MEHEHGAFKVNHESIPSRGQERGEKVPVAARSGTSARAAVQKIPAGILDKWLNLPKNYTVCRQSIHFFRPNSRQ